MAESSVDDGSWWSASAGGDRGVDILQEAASAPCRNIRLEEEVERLFEKTEAADEVGEEEGGGGSVVEGVVPAAVGKKAGQAGGDSEAVAQGAQRVVVAIRPGGAEEVESVDPRAEGVAGKGAQESFFGAVAVGDEGAAGEQAPEFGPQGDEGGGASQIGGRDAVDFSGGPGDGPAGGEKRAEGFAEAVAGGPEGDPDLDRDVGFAAAGSRGLEVEGREAGGGDGLHGGGFIERIGREGKRAGRCCKKILFLEWCAGEGL